MATLQQQISSFAVRLAEEFNKLRQEVKSLKRDILGEGVEVQYDTIKEVADFAKANKEIIDSLVDTANSHVAYVSQNKSETEKTIARQNINAVSTGDLYNHNADRDAHPSILADVNTVVNEAKVEIDATAQDVTNKAALAQNYSDSALNYKNAAEAAKNSAESITNGALASFEAVKDEVVQQSHDVSQILVNANVTRVTSMEDDGVIELITSADLPPNFITDIRKVTRELNFAVSEAGLYSINARFRDGDTDKFYIKGGAIFNSRPSVSGDEWFTSVEWRGGWSDDDYQAIKLEPVIKGEQHDIQAMDINFTSDSYGSFGGFTNDGVYFVYGEVYKSNGVTQFSQIEFRGSEEVLELTRWSSTDGTTTEIVSL